MLLRSVYILALLLICNLHNLCLLVPKLPHVYNGKGNSRTYVINEMVPVKGLNSAGHTIKIQQTLALRIVFIKSPNGTIEEAASLVSSQGSALLRGCSWGFTVPPLSAWLPLRFPLSLTAGDCRCSDMRQRLVGTAVSPPQGP